MVATPVLNLIGNFRVIETTCRYSVNLVPINCAEDHMTLRDLAISSIENGFSTFHARKRN